MAESEKTIVVPHDFTKIGDYALEHAMVISKIMENPIYIVHIAKDAKDIPAAELKCQDICEKTFKQHFIQLKYIVREGSIFKDIGEIASEVDANLVIMGTHGRKGIQKLTGSWALKVVVNSTVPFIIVQNPPEAKKFENIVFPIDFRTENKEKMQWVNYLYNYYKTKFFIIKQDPKDRIFKAKVKNNLVFARKYMEGKNIKYEIYTAPGKKKFYQETIDYAKQSKADMILVMTTRDISIADYALGADEQHIIANSEKIPVMCVNPDPSLRRMGGFSAMGG
ncbi:MAG: universal stress protein [Chlorobi bacterium]|nr:universal stress protein [Chlorobiota bacterium]